jgi:uncharacterized protein DUF222/HNH endonuclease
MSGLAGMSLPALEDEIATWSAHLAAGMCRWLELVGELDRRGGWGDYYGCTSCAHWLSWRCAVSPRSAREHVRVARRLPGLPHIRAAFAAGELSYAKVRALTRVAEPVSEQELLELARLLTASQLERAVRAYRRITSEDAQAVHEDAHLELCWDEEGALVLRGRLAPEDGALVLRALEAARDALAQEGRGSAEPRPTRTEALVALADATLAAAAGRSGGDRYQVVVHVDAAALSGSDDSGGCLLEDGPPLAAETARRLACDASVVAASDRDGHPLRLGRKKRTIPVALRRALQARDGGCRFPGCDNQRFLHAHHIRHWAHGGETSLDNLVLVCTRHHRLVHEGGYRLDQRHRFYNRQGRRLPPSGDPHAATQPSSNPRHPKRSVRTPAPTATANESTSPTPSTLSSAPRSQWDQADNVVQLDCSGRDDPDQAAHARNVGLTADAQSETGARVFAPGGQGVINGLAA